MRCGCSRLPRPTPALSSTHPRLPPAFLLFPLAHPQRRRQSEHIVQMLVGLRAGKLVHGQRVPQGLARRQHRGEAIHDGQPRRQLHSTQPVPIQPTHAELPRPRSPRQQGLDGCEVSPTRGKKQRSLPAAIERVHVCPACKQRLHHPRVPEVRSHVQRPKPLGQAHLPPQPTLGVGTSTRRQQRGRRRRVSVACGVVQRRPVVRITQVHRGAPRNKAPDRVHVAVPRGVVKCNASEKGSIAAEERGREGIQGEVHFGRVALLAMRP